MESTPAAPMPQKALAAMKLPMLCAQAHQAVVAARTTSPARYKGRRPNVSERRPMSGCNDVDVRRKAVDNQDAEFDAWKYEVMTG